TIVDHLRAIGGWFVVLLAIEAVAAICDGFAIYLMTRGPGAPDMREVLVAQFAGRAVNMVTPAANLGEALKVSLLARRCSTARLDELDTRLRRAEHRKGAAALVAASQLIQKVVTWATIVAAGYHLSPAQIIAVLSAGVVIGWISTLVPLGLGIAEGGNAALFS